MRKITEDAVRAFFRGENFSRSNTNVIQFKDGSGLMTLHGNQIARINADGQVEVTFAGWGTNTTKERLNGIAEEAESGRFFQKNFEMFYENFRGEITPVDTSEWVQLV